MEYGGGGLNQRAFLWVFPSSFTLYHQIYCLESHRLYWKFKETEAEGSTVPAGYAKRGEGVRGREHISYQHLRSFTICRMGSCLLRRAVTFQVRRDKAG